MTMILTRSRIEAIIDAAEVMTMLRRGFTETKSDINPLRVRTDLPGPGTATALLPGLIEGIPAYTVKVNAKFPDASPSVRGVVCLHDLRDGQLLALLDSATVTAWRTGLAAALATDVLARAGEGHAAVIGAGVQSRLMVQSLAGLRKLTKIVVYDINAARAQSFAQEHEQLLGVQVDVVRDIRKATSQARILLLSTWSRTPLLEAADLRAGTHVTALGADEPGKAELGADILRSARVVVDDIPLALAMGAVGNVGLGGESIHATFGQVLTEERAGRQDSSQITVYAPVGLPWQDLALAWPVYLSALGVDIFPSVDFLS